VLDRRGAFTRSCEKIRGEKLKTKLLSPLRWERIEESGALSANHGLGEKLEPRRGREGKKCEKTKKNFSETGKVGKRRRVSLKKGKKKVGAGELIDATMREETRRRETKKNRGAIEKVQDCPCDSKNNNTTEITKGVTQGGGAA